MGDGALQFLAINPQRILRGKCSPEIKWEDSYKKNSSFHLVCHGSEKKNI